MVVGIAWITISANQRPQSWSRLVGCNRMNPSIVHQSSVDNGLKMKIKRKNLTEKHSKDSAATNNTTSVDVINGKGQNKCTTDVSVHVKQLAPLSTSINDSETGFVKVKMSLPKAAKGKGRKKASMASAAAAAASKEEKFTIVEADDFDKLSDSESKHSLNECVVTKVKSKELLQSSVSQTITDKDSSIGDNYAAKVGSVVLTNQNKSTRKELQAQKFSPSAIVLDVGVSQKLSTLDKVRYLIHILVSSIVHNVNFMRLFEIG